MKRFLPLAAFGLIVPPLTAATTQVGDLRDDTAPIPEPAVPLLVLCACLGLPRNRR